MRREPSIGGDSIFITTPRAAEKVKSVPSAHSTGPIRLRALLTALALGPGPVRLPRSPSSTGRPDVRWFSYGRVVVELICDDPIAVAYCAGTFGTHHGIVPADRWIVTVLRAATLDAAPHAFVATPVVAVAPGIDGRYHHHDTMGDTWWITDPTVIIHNAPNSRWIGMRYTHPEGARDWAHRVVGRLLATNRPRSN